MFIIPSIDLSMRLSLSEVLYQTLLSPWSYQTSPAVNTKHVLFMNLSDFKSTTTRVTSVKYKKVPFGFLFIGEVLYCSRQTIFDTWSMIFTFDPDNPKKVLILLCDPFLWTWPLIWIIFIGCRFQAIKGQIEFAYFSFCFGLFDNLFHVNFFVRDT